MEKSFELGLGSRQCLLPRVLRVGSEAANTSSVSRESGDSTVVGGWISGCHDTLPHLALFLAGCLVFLPRKFFSFKNHGFVGLWIFVAFFLGLSELDGPIPNVN